MDRPWFWFACYQLGWHVLLPIILLRLWWRGRKDPGYRQAIAERFGFSQGIQPGAIWIHAVSVGETRAAQPLIDAYLQQGKSILLTCMTPNGRRTGAAIFADAIAQGRLQQVYLPYDLCWSVERFLKAAKPSLGLFMETEAWPTIVFRAAEIKLPVFLINARLSERSARRVARFGNAGRSLFQAFAGILAQTELDAGRYRALGVTHCEVVGNLKFDVVLNPALVEAGLAWHAYLDKNNRLMVCAASTREGEEAIILEAWQAMLQMHAEELTSVSISTPQPLLCIVPRHPERFAEVAELIRSSGLTVLQRSEIDLDASDWHNRIDLKTEVVLGDSMGEMPLYYSASDLVVMGGSLLPLGGQNLIEACAAGCPVLLGENTFNFQQASQDAIECGAAMRLGNNGSLVATLAGAISRILQHQQQRQAMREAALRYAADYRGATTRIMAALKGRTA
ncbi:MAG: 3-deoxy-D-manno-octulosonic acid transferase [Polynucleobacter sp.]|nr:3-deoxy-D-manno-octulosonic acid transferase [Polynucleobacter sp.]